MTLFANTVVRENCDALFDVLAETLLSAAQQAVEQRGAFHLALSGGSTPQPFYMRLVIDPDLRNFPWHKTHLWIVDERRVPPEDDRCNYKMIRESLVDHIPIKSRLCHPMPVLSDDPTAEYEQTLREVFASDDCPRLDFVLLGMGDDAHTASLFPRSSAIGVQDRWITVNEGENVTPPPRVTMTYPLLNTARELVVLATGQKKVAMIQKLRKVNEPDPINLPITGIHPADGELTWFMDTDANG